MTVNVYDILPESPLTRLKNARAAAREKIQLQEEAEERRLEVVATAYHDFLSGVEQAERDQAERTAQLSALLDDPGLRHEYVSHVIAHVGHGATISATLPLAQLYGGISWLKANAEAILAELRQRTVFEAKRRLEDFVAQNKTDLKTLGLK